MHLKDSYQSCGCSLQHISVRCYLPNLEVNSDPLEVPSYHFCCKLHIVSENYCQNTVAEEGRLYKSRREEVLVLSPKGPYWDILWPKEMLRLP